jgi:hypothetical protein
MYQLKQISKDTIPAAIEKAERYRLLMNLVGGKHLP